MPGKECDANLEAKQRFWRVLFEEQEIARQITALAEETGPYTPAVYNISHYGEVQVQVHPTSSLGDNFMSDAYVIEAHIVEGARDYYSFIKVLPSNSVMRESAKEWSVHEREVSVYHELFNVLREIRGGRPVSLAVPQVYYSNIDDLTDGSATCIVMENLKMRGFRMADKIHGADDAHARIALTSLAHYHSLTITAVRQWWDPLKKQLEKFPTNLQFLLEKTLLELNPAAFMQGWVDVYRDVSLDVNRPDLAKWFEEISSHLEDIMVADSIENGGSLACIMHGDFWNNNMLYQYDGEDRAIALKMVDFQIARFGHPLGDVLYFIYSSTNPGERQLFMEDWLRHYFETLTGSLKLLGSETDDYTWKDFLKDYRKKSIPSMLFGSLVISLALNEKVVDGLNDLHEETNQTVEKKSENAPVPETTEESVQKIPETVPGMDFTEKLTGILSQNKLSKNPLVTQRLVSLWDEVKKLNETN